MKKNPKFLVPTLLATTVAAAVATLTWYFGGKRRQPKPMGTAAA